MHATKTQGTLQADEIDAVVALGMQEVNFCYDLQVFYEQKLKGKIWVRWTVGSDGSVRWCWCLL